MIYSTSEYVVVMDESFLESNFFKEIDIWKTSNQKHAIQKFKSSTLTDEEYERMKSHLKTMRETDDYEEYKKAFSKFCYFCHIVPRGVIIRRYSLEKSKRENRNTLYVEYTYNLKKITLPEGTKLYHMSSVDNIQELIPVFRGKAARGYLYDKPRVYFTIRKNMPKFLADYKYNDKLNVYVCKEDIRQVYVDPLVWSNLQGAVYIETNRPIKVEKVTNKTISEILSKPKREKERISSNESTEGFDMNEFLDFVTENGLILEE